jgi:hypothetical protein
MEEGMELLKMAAAAKVTQEHDVIDEAIECQGDQFTVFSIVSTSAYMLESPQWCYLSVPQPVGVLYRPNENKLRNAQAKDYLGKAVSLFIILVFHEGNQLYGQKLVAASDGFDAYTDFSGAARLKKGISPKGLYLDPPGTQPGLTRSNTTPQPCTFTSKSCHSSRAD